MPAKLKLLLLLIADALILIASQIVTLLLMSQWYQNPLTPPLAVSAFIAISWLNGFYRTSIAHIGISAVKVALASSIISGLIALLLEQSGGFAVFSSLLAVAGFIAYRVLARELLFQQRHSGAARTLVYGAGSAGIQFVTASMQGGTHNVIAYLDDDPMLRSPRSTDATCTLQRHGGLN